MKTKYFFSDKEKSNTFFLATWIDLGLALSLLSFSVDDFGLCVVNVWKSKVVGVVFLLTILAVVLSGTLAKISIRLHLLLLQILL